MRYLIINADDFGFSPQINDGVCEAFSHGVLTESSLLVHSPYAEAALRLAAGIGLPVGVHLDLVTPFTTGHSVYFGPQGSLVKELFEREVAKKDGKPLSCELLLSIRDAFRSQVRLFQMLAGRLPSHLDYHFGLHYLPEVMALYLTVADEFVLPARWGCQYAGKKLYPLCPDLLCDEFRGVETGGMDLLLQLLSRPWAGIQELMCHPGFTTPNGLGDAYNQEREYELKVLTAPGLTQELDKLGIELINYKRLKSLYSGA